MPSFETHGTKSRDIEQHGIDPSPYLRTAKPEKPRSRKPFVNGNVPTTLSPELEEKKGTLMGMTENRHDLFYEFARE